MIKVVDNLISKKYQDKIINTVNDNYFPWYFYETILSDEEIKGVENYLINKYGDPTTL